MASQVCHSVTNLLLLYYMIVCELVFQIAEGFWLGIKKTLKVYIISLLNFCQGAHESNYTLDGENLEHGNFWR